MPKRGQTRHEYLRGGRTEAVMIWLFWVWDAMQGWLLDGYKIHHVNLVVILSYLGISGHEDKTHFTELNVSFSWTSWLSSWDLLSCVGILHEIVLPFLG